MGPELRAELMHDLKENRARSRYGGSGNFYWGTVIDTVEAFLDRHFKEEA